MGSGPALLGPKPRPNPGTGSQTPTQTSTQTLAQGPKPLPDPGAQVLLEPTVSELKSRLAARQRLTAALTAPSAASTVGTGEHFMAGPFPAFEGGCRDMVGTVPGGGPRTHFMPPSLLASQLATLEPPSASRFTAIRVDRAKGGSSSWGEGAGLASQTPSACRSAAAATSARREGCDLTHMDLSSSTWALVDQSGHDAAAVRDSGCGCVTGSPGAGALMAAGADDVDCVLLRIAPADADATTGAAGEAAAFPSVPECVELIVAAKGQGAT